jgi:hypothetical protein
MFVTKIQMEERRKQMPVEKSYPATVYVKFSNVESEVQGTPEEIELNIENQNGMMGCFLYVSRLKLGSDEQAAEFVKELKQLDAAIEIVEGRGDVS